MLDPFAPVAPAPNRENVGLGAPVPFGVGLDVGPAAGVAPERASNAATTAAALAGAAPGAALRRVLMELPPHDDAEQELQASGFATLIWFNPLQARINVNWGFAGASPSEDPQVTSTSQFLIPGVSTGAFPIPSGVTSIRATVLYPGAVPADDAYYSATLYVDTDALPVFVGPLA